MGIYNNIGTVALKTFAKSDIDLTCPYGTLESIDIFG